MAFSFKSFKKIGRILKPRVDVGGLEISDSGAVFMLIDPETKKISSYSVKFPAMFEKSETRRFIKLPKKI